MSSKTVQERVLLATMTNEPFQPVRLYYSIPSASAVIEKLRRLKCMSEVPHQQCWEWSLEAECASLRFPGGGYHAVPKEKRPIVLGRIRFPTLGRMTLETNSIERAIAGARLFAPHFGPEVVATRLRVVNRFFFADEGQPSELMTTLDRDVTVIDPRETEEAFRNHFRDVRLEDRKRALIEYVEKAKAERDVPLVEDFPLAPEEETPDFLHLANTLQFRFMRAFEHWRGNTHLTIGAIITRAVEQHMRAQREQAGPTGRNDPCGCGSGKKFKEVLRSNG